MTGTVEKEKRKKILKKKVTVFCCDTVKYSYSPYLTIMSVSHSSNL